MSRSGCPNFAGFPGGKTLLRAILCAALAVIAACAPIKREAGYPGGNIGYYADQRLYLAQSHQQRLDRNLVVLALLAPLAAHTAQTEDDAEASIVAVNRVYKKLRFMSKALETCNFKDRYLSNGDTATLRIVSQRLMGVQTTTVIKAKSASSKVKLSSNAKATKVEGLQTGEISWDHQAVKYRFEGLFLANAPEPTEDGGEPGPNDKNITLYDGNLHVAAGNSEAVPASVVCEQIPHQVGGPSIYDFERLDFQAQQALFKLARTSADNLGIEITKASVKNVSLKGTVSLLSKARRLLPVLMNYLATYRDVAVVYSDSVAQECAKNVNGMDAPGRCNRLLRYFQDGFVKMLPKVPDEKLILPISTMFKTAEDASKTVPDWRLGDAQISALVKHVDVACRRMERFLEAEADEEQNGGKAVAALSCKLVKKDDNDAFKAMNAMFETAELKSDTKQDGQ